MLTTGPDPFGTYPTSDESSEIFTVLPATSLISPTPHHPSSPRDVTQAPFLPQNYVLTDTVLIPSALGDFTDISYAYGYARDTSNANAAAYLRDPFLRVDMVGTQSGIVSAAVEETPLGRNGSGAFAAKATAATNDGKVQAPSADMADLADVIMLEVGRNDSIAEVEEENTQAVIENLSVKDQGTEEVVIQESTKTVKQRVRSESGASKRTDSEEDVDTDIEDVDDEETLLNTFASRMGTSGGSDPNPLRIGSEVFKDQDFSFREAEAKEAFTGRSADNGYSTFREKREQAEGNVRAFEQIVI